MEIELEERQAEFCCYIVLSAGPWKFVVEQKFKALFELLRPGLLGPTSTPFVGHSTRNP